MTILTRTEYLARYGDMRSELFDENKTCGRHLAFNAAFRDDLGWPVVPLPDSFSSVCSGPMNASGNAEIMLEEGVRPGTEEWEEGVRSGKRHDVIVERIWHPLFELLGHIGAETLVGVSMWDMRIRVEGQVQDFIRYEIALAEGKDVAPPNAQGKLKEDQHAIEFPNDWSQLGKYLDWDERSMDDNVIFDQTLGWGIHSWEEEPYSFFSAPRQYVEAYLEAIGGGDVLRGDLDWFLADNEEGYGFTERFNAFISQSPFVTAGVPAGYTGPSNRP